METSAYYSFDDAKEKEVREDKPLSRSDIFWGVFGGMWAFGVTGGIVTAVLYALIR